MKIYLVTINRFSSSVFSPAFFLSEKRFENRKVFIFFHLHFLALELQVSFIKIFLLSLAIFYTVTASFLLFIFIKKKRKKKALCTVFPHGMKRLSPLPLCRLLLSIMDSLSCWTQTPWLLDLKTPYCHIFNDIFYHNLPMVSLFLFNFLFLQFLHSYFFYLVLFLALFLFFFPYLFLCSSTRNLFLKCNKKNWVYFKRPLSIFLWFLSTALFQLHSAAKWHYSFCFLFNLYK